MNAPLLPAVVALWKRELLGFFRQRSRLIGALATPLLFWLLIGSGLGRSFQEVGGGNGASDGGYLKFFFPGMLALNVLFTAIFSTISVIQDRHAGFLQGVLVAPIPRSALVWGKILGGATLGLLQGLLLLLFAPFAGFALPLANLLPLLLLIYVLGAALTALGFYFAWKIDSVQGFHGIMNTVLMPLWILSGAMFPASGSSQLLVWVMRLNPLNYGLLALRSLLNGEAAFSATVITAFAVLGTFSTLLFALCLRVVGKGLRAS